MKRKVMNLQEGKLLKTWLKRKVRVTEALIVAFFIAGNLGYGQESSSQDSNTKEGGIAIGRLIEVELKNGAVISVFPKANENGKYSFAEKGNAKAELFKDYEAGFHLKNMKNGYSLIGRYNENYEKVIGKNNHSNNNGEDKYANSKTNNVSSAQDSDEDKIAKSIAIGGNSVARNASIAIGDYAFASKKMDENNETKDTVKGAAIAIGSFATATASSAISLGAAASAQGSNSIALGRQSVAVEETSIAIGKVAAAAGKGSIAIGSATEAEGENSVVIGKESKTKKLSDMNNNESNGKEKMKISEEVKTRLMKKSESEDLSGSNDSLEATVILGASSIATGKHGVTLGYDVRNYGNDGVSIGNQSLVSGHGGIAIGKWAGAYQDKSLALGYDVEAHSIYGMALGVEAIQRGDKGIAIGYQAKSKGNDSIAIGTNAKVGNGNIADMKVSSDSHTHIDTINGKEKEVEKAIALGNNAKVEVSNSIALGADSEAKKYEKVEEVKIKPLSLNSMNGQANSQDEIKIPTEKFAGMKKNGNGSSGTNGNGDLGVVSIGKKGEERQLQHVAAGRISENSTDAINGSQLFAVASYLSSGWKIANGSGVVGDVSLGKQVSFVGEQGVKVSVEKENGEGYKVKISTPGAATKKDLKDLEKKGLIFMGNDGTSIHRNLGQTLRIKGEGLTQEQSKNFSSAKGNINVRYKGKSILEIQLAKELKHIESISNGGDTKGTKITLEKGRKEVNVNGAKITNVADGKADTDAVNLKQLKEYNIKLEKKGLSFVGNDEETVHRNLGSTLNIKGEGLSKSESKNFKGAKGNINVKKSDKDGELLLQLAEKLQNIQSISNRGSNGGTTIILKEKEIVVNKDLHMGEKGSEHQIKHLKEGTEITDAVNKGQLDREVARASTEIKAGKNIEVKETIGTNGQKQYEVALKDNITLGEKEDSKVAIDGTNGKVTIGDKISLNGKTGEAKFGKIQMNQEKNEKGDTKATITGLENTDIIAEDFAKKGRAATEEQLQKVHQDANKKIENLSREITDKGLNFGADKGENVHRNLGDTQKIVGDKKNIMTSVEENGDIQVALNSEISVEKVSIPNKEGGESVRISSENGAGNIYLAGKPGENRKATGAKISVEEGKAGVEAKDPKEKMERIVYQDSKGNSHTVATHDDGLKFEGDDGKTVNKKLNETLQITGGEKDPKKLSQGNIGVISTEDGGLTIQLAKELKDLSKITLVDGNGNKAVIDGGSLVFEGQDGKKTSLTSKGLDNGGNRITNVAAGEAPTDAVNVSQLNEVKGAVQQNAQRIDKMNGEMRRGLASAAAMSGLEFMEIGINQGTVAAAVGGWKGTQAVAVGIQGAPTENVRINGKVSVAPGYKQVDTMYSVGASYRFNWK
ncbi:YadA-like family protein [Fusobacterium necrophorum]|uniref:YadA-like family protein n=1 Tax=Fusobacterium necrophorum TaxID=859 RepID=UPI0021BE9837|nr:YadA-like family protein [Fusobacterium necrophorum]